MSNEELMGLVDELVLLVAEAAGEQLAEAATGALHLTVAGFEFSYSPGVIHQSQLRIGRKIGLQNTGGI